MTRDQKRWKEWAEGLRQTMMTELESEVTKSVADILQETQTEKTALTLATQKFWDACIKGEGSYGTLSKAGFQLSYEANGSGKVETVTFQLNDTWRSIMQRVLDRQV